MADEQLIKPRELPPAAEVYADDAIMTDDGVTVGKATPGQIVNAGAPVATEAEAIAGVNNVKRMTPLRTKQVLDNVTAPSVARAQAWAESSTAPDPGVPGSKSAKSWAAEAESFSNSAKDAMEETFNSAPFAVSDVEDFFQKSKLVLGARYFSKNGSSWDISDPGTGELTHPITGQGVSVVPVSDIIRSESFRFDPSDETESLNVASVAASSVPLSISPGDHLFNGENLSNIDNIYKPDNATVRNGIYSGIIQSDSGKSWLQQNHLEYSTGRITTGNIPSAPLFTGSKQSETDVIALWYQDFGLEATRAAGGTLGSLTWYYWSWLFHDAPGDGYQSERQPTLGYYRGDDANVIDWQCYWLSGAGVTTIVPQARGKLSELTKNWSSENDVNYWMYQLFNNCKNFNTLRYTLWAWSASNTFGDVEAQAEVDASFDEILSCYSQYKNFGYVIHKGKKYPQVYVYQVSFWRGLFDNYSGNTNTIAMLSRQAAKFKAAGFGGVAIIGRDNSVTLVGNESLESSGVLMYGGAYVDTYNPALNGGIDPPLNYEDRANGVDVRHVDTFPYNQSIACVSTSRDSHSAHPSSWNWPGSTPELFERMCRNALNRMDINGSPRMLLVYNVSEWAEGGSSLMPNMRDGSGYLDALRNALSGVSVGSIGTPYSGPIPATFTPIVSDAAYGGNPGTPSQAFGTYIVNGGVCHASIQITNIVTSGMASANDIFITGLPVPARNMPGTQKQVGYVQSSMIAFSGNLSCEVQDTWTYLKIFSSSGGSAGEYLKVSSMTSGQADIYINISYLV